MSLFIPSSQTLRVHTSSESALANVRGKCLAAVLVLLGPDGQSFNIPLEAYLGGVLAMDSDGNVDVGVALLQREVV